MRFGQYGSRIAYAPETGTGDGGGADQGGGGQQQQAAAAADAHWSAGLDDGAKALIGTRGWADKPVGEVLPQVFKSYGELEALVGTSVKVPGADAKPEDLQAFYRKLGAPETADKYQIPVPAGGQYGEGDIAFQKSVLPVLHAAGITQRQLEQIAPAWNALQAEQAKAHNSAAETLATTTRAGLIQEWGGEDKFAANIDLANRAFKATFGEDVPAATTLRLADGTFLADSPVWAKAFAKLGARMAEDGALPESGDNGSGAGNAVGGAKEQLAAIYAAAASDPKHPYVDPKHPEHSAMLDKVMKLSMQQANAR